jgi:hypothetical protein
MPSFRMAVMIDPTPEITRLAAARLADLDSYLPAATERVLAGQSRPRVRGLDANLTLTLASFLLGLAQFGWAIYQERGRGKTEEARELLVRRLRMRIGQVDGEDLLPPGSRDRVVDVVVEEILALEASGR